MLRTIMKYSSMMIITYLMVAYATGSGRVIDSGSSGASNIIKAFQGR